MYIEIIVVAALIFVVLTVNGFINPNKFVQDNSEIFKKLKEDDYDFFLWAKYGDGLDPDVLYQKRIKNSLLIIILAIFIMMKDLSLVGIVVACVAGFGIFKMDYSKCKWTKRKRASTFQKPHFKNKTALPR